MYREDGVGQDLATHIVNPSLQEMEVVVVGATGLCASAFIKKAVGVPELEQLWTFARRKSSALPKSDKLREYTGDSSEWESAIPQATSDKSLFFSGIATTRAAAGGLDKQRLIDHDLQVKMAKIAKSKGYKTFVLISSVGANPSSYMGYIKMKGETEEDIKAIGFERTLIMRPGPLIGRETSHSGFGSSFMGAVFPLFYKSWAQRLVSYPVHANDVAAAVLKLASTAPKGVTIAEGKKILDLANEQ